MARQFKGPVRPGEDEETFRKTGKTQRLVRGPVQPGVDEKKFRRGGSGSSRDSVKDSEAVIREQANRLEAEKAAAEGIEKARNEAQEARRTNDQQRLLEANQAIQDKKAFIKESRKTSVNVETNKRIKEAIKVLENAPEKRETFEKRVVSTEGGIPNTAFFNVATGQKADLETQTKLRGLERQNQDLVITSGKQKSAISFKLKEASFSLSKLNTNISQNIKGISSKASGSVGGPTTLAEARANVASSSKVISDAGFKRTAKFGSVVSSAGLGIAQDVADKPLKQVALYGVGRVAAIGFRVGTAAAAAKGGAKASKLFQSTAAAGGSLLIASEAAVLDTKISLAKTGEEKAGIIGVASKDLGLIGFGGVKGTRDANKIIDAVRTRGRTEIPIGDFGLVKDATSVLTGKTKFVESELFGGSNKPGLAKQKFDKKVFERAGRFYQAAPDSFSKPRVIIDKGSSEFEGLYGAPNPSVYFFKAGEQPVKLFGTVTSGTRPGLSIVKNKEFTLLGKQKPGKPFVTGIKSEIESVLPPDNVLVRTGQQTFTEFGGRKIPVDTFKIENVLKGINKPKTAKGSGSTKGSGSSSSFKRGVSSSLITPELSGLSSFGSSRASSKVSSVRSSLTSSGSSILRGSSGGSSSGRSSRGLSSSGRSSISRILYGGSSSSGGFSSSSPDGSRTGLGRFGSRTLKKKREGLFGVEIRRAGKFRSIGTRKTAQGAAKLLQDVLGNTLAASGRITGGRVPTLAGLRKPKKGSKLGVGQIFVEKRSLRLSKRGEKKEIQAAKRKKKKKRKK